MSRFFIVKKRRREKRDWIFLIVFLALQMRSRLNFFFFFSEDLSVLSEDVASLMSPDEHFENDWLPSHNSIQDAEYGQELVSKGNPKAEVQLRYVTLFLFEIIFSCQNMYLSHFKRVIESFRIIRYLLQIMMEANCLEIASLISVLLKDALALIRIVNAARSSGSNSSSSSIEEVDKTVVSRLYQNLKALEAWAQSEW